MVILTHLRNEGTLLRRGDQQGRSGSRRNFDCLWLEHHSFILRLLFLEFNIKRIGALFFFFFFNDFLFIVIAGLTFLFTGDIVLIKRIRRARHCHSRRRDLLLHSRSIVSRGKRLKNALDMERRRQGALLVGNSRFLCLHLLHNRSRRYSDRFRRSRFFENVLENRFKMSLQGLIRAEDETDLLEELRDRQGGPFFRRKQLLLVNQGKREKKYNRRTGRNCL